MLRATRDRRTARRTLMILATTLSLLAGTVLVVQSALAAPEALDGAGNRSGASNTTTASSSAVIAVAGDIACANTDARYNGGNGTATACRQKATSNLLVGHGYAAVLALGDNQYNSGSLSQFQAVYGPTPGTREVHHASGGRQPRVRHFEGVRVLLLLRRLPPATSKGYYSFNIGSWHLIALNSNCTIVACTTGSAQETWLRNDLAAHSNLCTLAFDHHARWSRAMAAITRSCSPCGRTSTTPTRSSSCRGTATTTRDSRRRTRPEASTTHAASDSSSSAQAAHS